MSHERVETHSSDASQKRIKNQIKNASHKGIETHIGGASHSTDETHRPDAKYQVSRGLMEAFYDLQKNRVAIGNRLISRCSLMLSKSTVKKVKRACTKPESCEQCIHYTEAEDKKSLRTHNWIHPQINPQLKTFYAQIHNVEKTVYCAIIQPEAAKIPIYNAWLKKVKGIGPAYTLGLVSFIRDIGRFDTVSKLWAYAGFRPGQKLRKGEKVTWNPRLRTLMWKIGKQFVRQGGVYRRLYLENKHYYATQRPDLANESKGHIDAMAIRKTVKMFLSRLWLHWRELEGLPTRPPYAMEKLGHTTMWPVDGKDMDEEL